jgi:hypothetical protein
VDHQYATLLFGEWFFAQGLFGREWDGEYPLLKEPLEGPGDDGNAWQRVELLRQAHDGVEVYLDDCLSAVPWEQYNERPNCQDHQSTPPVWVASHSPASPSHYPLGANLLGVQYGVCAGGSTKMVRQPRMVPVMKYR